MKRILGGLMAAIFAIALITPVALAKQGDEHLPCPDGGHFILSPFEGQPPTFEGLTFDKQSGKAVHYLSGPLTVVEFNAIVAQNENLKLSHCLEGSTPSPTPSTTPSATPSVSPTPTPTSTPTSTPSPTPSVEPTPTPTPTATPTSTPTASPSPTSTPEPTTSPRVSIPTPPPTDTEPSESSTGSDPGMVGWLVLALAAAIGLYAMTRRLKTVK